jgi:hypothetical protein
MLTCTQFKIYVDAKDSVQNGIIFWERVCLRWKRQQLAFVHDIFISLKSEVGVHKTSFIQAFFIEVIVARKSEQMCIFVLCVSILRLAAIYQLIVYYKCGIFRSFTFYLENRFGFRCTGLDYHVGVFELLLRNNFIPWHDARL